MGYIYLGSLCQKMDTKLNLKPQQHQAEKMKNFLHLIEDTFLFFFFKYKSLKLLYLLVHISKRFPSTFDMQQISTSYSAKQT